MHFLSTLLMPCRNVYATFKNQFSEPFNRQCTLLTHVEIYTLSEVSHIVTFQNDHLLASITQGGSQNAICCIGNSQPPLPML